MGKIFLGANVQVANHYEGSGTGLQRCSRHFVVVPGS